MYRNIFTITATDESIICAIVTDKIDELKKYVTDSNVNKIIDSKNGFTALHHAIKHGNKEIITYLLSLNPNTEIKTLCGDDIYDLSLKYHNRIIFDIINKKKDDKISSLEKDVFRLNDDNKYKDTRINYLSKSIDQTYAKNQGLNTKITEAEKEIKDLKKKNENMSLELNNTQLDVLSNKRKFQDMDRKITNLENDNKSLLTEKNNLSKKNYILEKENSDLITDNKDFKQKNEALHEKYTKLDESYTSLLKRNRKV